MDSRVDAAASSADLHLLGFIWSGISQAPMVDEKMFCANYVIISFLEISIFNIEFLIEHVLSIFKQVDIRRVYYKIKKEC